MDLYRLLATSTDPWSISQLVTTVIPTVDGPGISASAIGITALIIILTYRSASASSRAGGRVGPRVSSGVVNKIIFFI